MKILRTISALTIVLLVLLVLPASAGYVWENTTVDDSGVVEGYISLAFDGDGNPAITYKYSRDGRDSGLVYAWIEGDVWQNTIVDVGGSVGLYTSLAFNATTSAISYFNGSSPDSLCYAWMEGGVWENTTVDSGDVGLYTSLAFNGSTPAISYFDVGKSDLKYAWMEGGVWENITVDSFSTIGSVGPYTSLAFNGPVPAISYYDAYNGNLKYAWKEGGVWENSTVDVALDVGQYTSLAFDSGGNPAISYYDVGNGNLKYAWKNASGWQNITVDADGVVGLATSLAFSADGNPAISYLDQTNNDLKFAWKSASSWQNATVDAIGAVSIDGDTSLAFNGSIAAIAYWDEFIGDPRDEYSGNLKYATGTPADIINVTSDPPGAAVWLNGAATNMTTPAQLSNVPPGTHNVTVILGGFLPGVNDTVGVVFDKTTDVAFSLTPVMTPTTPTPTPTPTPDTGGDDPMDDTAIAVAKGLAAGENVTLGLDPSLSAIYQIQVTAKGSIATLLVTARTTGSPESAVPAPDGIVYQFIEVTLFKTTDDHVDHAEMMFTVPLAWLEANGVTPANVVLYRWHDGAWQPLPTTFVKSEGGKAYFAATSPGFSLFAIVAVDEPVTIAVTVDEDDTPVPAEEPTVDGTPPADATASPTPVTTATAATTSAPEETAGAEPTKTPASPLVAALGVALGALLVLGKRR